MFGIMKRDAESSGFENAAQLRVTCAHCDVVTGGPIVDSITVTLPPTAKVDDVKWGLARNVYQVGAKHLSFESQRHACPLHSAPSRVLRFAV